MYDNSHRPQGYMEVRNAPRPSGPVSPVVALLALILLIVAVVTVVVAANAPNPGDPDYVRPGSSQSASQ
jgi:4-hydroxybenzoate polyprenyltransferase